MDFEEVAPDNPTPDNVTPDEDTERLRGRPRDPAIGDSALAAARELLAEVGWDKTTMVAISERAGVGKPALYRRWPSKTHLVFEAVFGWVDESPPVADATDPEEWVRASCNYTLELFAKPEVKAALPGLLSAFAERGDLPSTLWSEFGGPGIAMLAQMLNRGGGDADAMRDAQATMLFIVGGTMVLRMLMPETDSAPLVERMPDILLHGVAPKEQKDT